MPVVGLGCRCYETPNLLANDYTIASEAAWEDTYKPRSWLDRP